MSLDMLGVLDNTPENARRKYNSIIYLLEQAYNYGYKKGEEMENKIKKGDLVIHNDVDNQLHFAGEILEIFKDSNGTPMEADIKVSSIGETISPIMLHDCTPVSKDVHDYVKSLEETCIKIGNIAKQDLGMDYRED